MLNKVTLIGRFGADPEIKYMPNGGAVVSTTLATTTRFKDKATGERKESTEWHRVVFFNRLAEIVSEHLKKGSQIYVEGSLKTRKWQGQDGQDRYTTEILAREMHMIGNKPEGQQSSGAQQSKPTVQNAAPSTDYDEFDDDVPF